MIHLRAIPRRHQTGEQGRPARRATRRGHERAKGNERSKGNWGGHWLSWIAAAERNREAAKIVRQYHQRPAEELYYLPEDSHEEKNLAGEPNHSEKLKTMRGRLTEWMREQGDEGKVYGEGIPLGKGSN